VVQTTAPAQRRAWGPTAWLTCAYTVAFSVWVALGQGSATQRELLSDLAPLPMGALAAFMAWRAGSDATADAATRRAWRLMAGAFVLWWAGDVTWFVLEAVLHRTPFPSPADAGYLGFYPVMALGLLALPLAPRTREERIKAGLDALTVLLAAAMVVWYLVVGPIVRDNPSGLSTVLNVAYPVGDLVLLYGVVMTLLRRRGDLSLWLLLGGVASFVVADLSYAHLSLSDSYAGGDWPDAFWMSAQCLFLLGAVARAGRPSSAPTGNEAGAGSPGRVSMLPYGAIVLGYALLIAVGRGEASTSLEGLLVGAAAITAVVVLRQMRVTAENVRLLTELHHLAEVDDLTAMLNRRSFFETGERLFRRSEHLDRPLAVLMLDIDHFKAVNDTFGHGAGDEVLASVAARTRAQLRETDVVGRYGGDELAVIMPDCEVEEAYEVAERIRRAVGSTPVLTGEGVVSATLSIGVSAAAGSPSLAAALGRADAGLYEAKRAGRGRTAVAAVPG
jgi:diguanylate cyclase (GGDEF)-like protein